MEIVAENVGKRYRRRFIFKKLNHRFEHNTCWAICGPNGSGKSTLLKILAGYTSPTQGKVKYSIEGKDVIEEDAVLRFSFVAPYQEVIEEFTLGEMLDFHFQFRAPTAARAEMLERAQLTGSERKYIHEFSSGMKQRLKLILAFYTEASCLFLDEPTSNLDDEGIKWYEQEMLSIKGNKNIIIASNQRYEYAFTNQILQVKDFL
ncbi:MAG: ABC transporter ATP-binding protein [Bacteroidota bacterium]